MRIDSITLRNFRSHANEHFGLDRLTFITGPNASGKSSVGNAIEFLLTGCCSFTDAAGRGADGLIRTGAAELAIEADVTFRGNDPNKLFRAKSAKGHTFSVNGHPVEIRLAQDGIERLAGTTGDVLSAVLNSSRFLQLDDKAQKALLTQVLASEKIAIPEEILADMRGVGVGAAATLESIERVDELYKCFFDLRTDTNREIKALGNLQAPATDEEAPDYESTWKRLNELRTELTLLTSQKARTEERYKAEVGNVTARREALATACSAAMEHVLPEDEARRLQAIADNREKLESLSSKISAAKQSIAEAEAEARNEIAAERGRVEEKRRAIQAQIAQKEDQIAILTRIRAAECPTCQRPLAAKEKASLGMRLNDELEGIKKSLSAAEAEMPGLNVPESEVITKLRNRLAKLETEIAAFGDISAAEQTLKSHRQAIVDADRAGRELKALKEPDAPNTSELASKIEELNTRIANGEEVLRQVSAIETERKAFREWKEKRDRLEKRLEVLSRLLDFFGANGVKTKLVGGKIGPFTEAINEALAHFGYRAEFSLEPYSFLIGSPVTAPKGPCFSPRQLSESEQFRFSVAFQVALAHATGLNFVLIDRADILDSESRGQLTEMLLESGLEQAIVMSTTDRPAPEDLPTGVKFVELGQKAVAA